MNPDFATIFSILDKLCAQTTQSVCDSTNFFEFCVNNSYTGATLTYMLSHLTTESGLSESVANERREWFIILLAQAMHEAAARLVRQKIGFEYQDDGRFLEFRASDGSVVKTWRLPDIGLMRCIAVTEFRNWISLQRRNNKTATMLEIVSALMQGGLSRGFSAALLDEYEAYLRAAFPAEADALLTAHLEIREKKDAAKTLDNIVADMRAALDPTARLLALACRLQTMTPKVFDALVEKHPAYFGALRTVLAKHELDDAEPPVSSSAAESEEAADALFAQFDAAKGPGTIEFQVGNILKSAAAADASTGAVNYRRALAQLKRKLSQI